MKTDTIKLAYKTKQMQLNWEFDYGTLNIRRGVKQIMEEK